MNEYQNLADAIIIKAVEDYRNWRNDPRRLKEIEDFFLSDWFKALSSIDGQALLERLKAEDDF